MEIKQPELFLDVKEILLKKEKGEFRYEQFLNSIYMGGIEKFSQILKFPKILREELENEKKNFFQLKLIEKVDDKFSTKYLFNTKEGYPVEAVLMKHKDNRKTICVSCQVFCPLGCKFCATGAQKFQRNLTCQEIIEQALFIQMELKKNKKRISNVVFMGMGEPFLNYENVIQSILVFNDRRKFDIGARNIIVSTSGIIDKIIEYSNFPLQTKLAISLHSPNQELRKEIMPISISHPLDKLICACDKFVENKNKRISYEYVLIENVNCDKKYAVELAKLLRGKLAHINLLIYNPHEFSDYKRCSLEVVLKFKKVLDDYGIPCSIRKSMGDEIAGACGQLSGQRIKK